MALNNIVKPKSKRHARLMQKQKPLVFENDKNALFIKGGRTSETVKTVLKEFASMKKPLSTMYYKKNMTKPFDDSSSIEFFSEKSDSSLFMFGSDSKKRPNNLILGRTFDFQILDMFEFQIEKFISLQEFKNRKVTAGSKPCLIFCGDAFDATPENTRLMNLLIDFFRGPKVTQISLAGFEHALIFALQDEKLFVRSYRILLKKSGTKTPQIELEEVGPSLNLKLRRIKIASEEMYRLARRVPKEAKIKKQKNVSHDAFSSKIGQIHMQTQDFSNLTLSRSKGFKRKRGETENPTNKKQKTEESEAMELEEEQ